MTMIMDVVCVLSLLCANGVVLPIMCTSCVRVSEPYSLVFCPWIVSPIDSSALACWAAVCAWCYVDIIIWSHDNVKGSLC